MAYHTLIYRDSAGSTAVEELSLIADQVAYSTNNHAVFTKDVFVFGAYAGGATLSQARFYTSSSRGIAENHIMPLNLALLPIANHGVADYTDCPFRIRAFEELVVDGLDTATGVQNAILFLGDTIDPIPSGTPTRVLFTSSTAAVGSTWTDVVAVASSVIPMGTYKITQLLYQATNAIAARLILDNQVYRPGTFGYAANTTQPSPFIQNRKLGCLGTFKANSLPRFQVYNSSTDSAHRFYLEIVKVSDN